MRLDDYPMIPLFWEDEKWAEIKDFPDYYWISNYGQVWSCRSKRLLKPALVAGYPQVIFSISRSLYMRKVHRLVAETFVPGWFDGAQINHIDGDKLNNHESNLEWVTGSENAKHAHRLGLSKSNAKKKRVISSTGQIFPSVSECAKFYGTRQGQISNILTGQRPSWKGMTFKYYDE
jgi:hypothetical protein